MHKIIICGGGAYFFKEPNEFLMLHKKQILIPKEPEMANAIGFYRYGVMQNTLEKYKAKTGYTILFLDSRFLKVIRMLTKRYSHFQLKNNAELLKHYPPIGILTSDSHLHQVSVRENRQPLNPQLLTGKKEQLLFNVP